MPMEPILLKEQGRYGLAFERAFFKFRNEGALMYEGRDHVLVSKHRLDRIALWLKSVKGKRSST